MQPNGSAFLLTPLNRQPTRDLLVTLFIVGACGLPLRRELQCPGVPDDELIRRHLRRAEWEIDR